MTVVFGYTKLLNYLIFKLQFFSNVFENYFIFLEKKFNNGEMPFYAVL